MGRAINEVRCAILDVDFEIKEVLELSNWGVLLMNTSDGDRFGGSLFQHKMMSYKN